VLLSWTSSTSPRTSTPSTISCATPTTARRIGLILCTTHNQTVAKFALHRSGAPIAVAGQGGDPHPSRPEATIA
jgi:hypothetical protein